MNIREEEIESIGSAIFHYSKNLSSTILNHDDDVIIEDDESIQGDDLTVTNKRVDEADVAKELSEVESEEAKQGDKEDDDEDIGANDEIEEVFLSCNFDKNDPVMVQLVFTKQFKPKLCHNGHFYTIDKVLELSNTITNREQNKA